MLFNGIPETRKNFLGWQQSDFEGDVVDSAGRKTGIVISPIQVEMGGHLLIYPLGTDLYHIRGRCLVH